MSKDSAVRDALQQKIPESKEELQEAETGRRWKSTLAQGAGLATLPVNTLKVAMSYHREESFSLAAQDQTEQKQTT